jgi:hypothetical protein
VQFISYGLGGSLVHSRLSIQVCYFDLFFFGVDDNDCRAWVG